MRSAPPHVVVIGAGVGGLAAALTLAGLGVAVTLVERAASVGGKLRTLAIAGRSIDAGPTVLTMRSVFETLFARAGESLDDHLRLIPATILARHAWQDQPGRLDLHADPERSADAIGDFAGASEARNFRRFCAAARTVFDTLEGPFIQADRPDLRRLLGPAARAGAAFATAPFSSLWRALGRYFADPRLRQLFARYATYCGSSPFDCPATLMLVAHVEQSGVWMVEGGMHRIATALADLATARGTTIRLGREVTEIRVEAGRAAAVVLDDGDRIAADAVLCNADCAAFAAGAFGGAARTAAPASGRADRSLSAAVFAMLAAPGGFPLVRHNVFFSPDYRAEFDALGAGRIPGEPTVYLCAQDRGDDAGAPQAPERLFCIVNAPAVGDSHTFGPSEIAQCEATTLRALGRCGLTITSSPDRTLATMPDGFHRLFPATGGALYGAASRGCMASFRRPGVRSRIPGLYLCGGSVHPGPGLPMAALSGQMAALAVTADWASMRRSRPVAMRGGTSMA